MTILKFMSKSKSQNVVADLKLKNASKTIVIVGHYDTPIETIYMKFLGKVYNILFKKKDSTEKHYVRDNKNLPFIFKTPMLIPNLGIIFLFLMILTGYKSTILEVYVGFVCAYCIVFSILAWISPYVPGALDNGVAAAMVVDLASYFKSNPLKNTDLIFLNTGCEEDAIKGIAHFVKNTKLEKENTYFLNLESIGASEPIICYAESDLWTGWPLNYDKDSYEFAKNIIKGDIRFKQINEGYIPAPSDMVVVVKNGYKVITMIASVSEEGFPEQYHQMFDIEENIDWSGVALSREFAIELISKFDKQFS